MYTMAYLPTYANESMIHLNGAESSSTAAVAGRAGEAAAWATGAESSSALEAAAALRTHAREMTGRGASKLGT